MTRDEIVIEAREWIGTKWQHQQSLKGVAVDCIGLVRGCYASLTGIVFTDIIDYAQSSFFYCREERLYPELQKYLIEIPVAEAKLGDILTFALKKRFPDHHLGIISGDGFIIHSVCEPGIMKVIESRLDDKWRGYIRHAFRYPGVVD
jgi:NlpC/P60 family putative phage cell wall peptidase